MRKIISEILVLLIFTSCVYDPGPEKIEIFNNSSSTVYAYYSQSDSISNDIPLELFHKTTSIDGQEKFTTAPSYRLSPYSRFEGAGIHSYSWKRYFDNSPDKMLRVFFISEEVMKNNSWSEIVKDQLYLKRIKTSIDDLEKSDWLLEYNQ